MARGLAALRAQGVGCLAVLGLINRHLNREAAWSLVPDWVEHRGDENLDETADLLSFAREHEPAILPFVDTRHLWGDVPAFLRRCVQVGFRGLKGIHLAEHPNDLGVASVPQTFGVSRTEYLRREWEIFGFAQAHDLPVIYHVDVRGHGDVVRAMLQDFPDVRFDFPHFGISRRALGDVLECHANVFTDLASMLPHVRRDPGGYRDFICRYPDRVCFGSDAFLYRLETVSEYLAMVRELALPDEVEARVLRENPKRFLGLGRPRAGSEGTTSGTGNQ